MGTPVRSIVASHDLHIWGTRENRDTAGQRAEEQSTYRRGAVPGDVVKLSGQYSVEVWSTVVLILYIMVVVTCGGGRTLWP